MKTYRIIFPLLIVMSVVSAVWGQEKEENRVIKSIEGTVISTDSVGNIISIRTDDQRQMAFSVPEKTAISQETHTIGLMDIGKADDVTVRYYVAAVDKYTAVSIVDDKSMINE